MSSARRSLLTATAAGTLLGALWFVPSANATADKPVEQSVEQQHRADTSLSTMSDFTRQISTTSTHTNTNKDTNTSTNTSKDASTDTSKDAGTSGTSATTTSDSSDSGTGDGTRLADTGSFDTTPYAVGGTLCLGLGAGFVVYSLRRERLGF